MGRCRCRCRWWRAASLLTCALVRNTKPLRGCHFGVAPAIVKGRAKRVPRGRLVIFDCEALPALDIDGTPEQYRRHGVHTLFPRALDDKPHLCLFVHDGIAVDGRLASDV